MTPATAKRWHRALAAVLVSGLFGGSMLLPAPVRAAQTTNPATALDARTFVVVSQDGNQIGRYNVSLFKIESERIVLKDSVDVELGEIQAQTTLTRQRTTERDQ